jgi:hypothetical protein
MGRDMRNDFFELPFCVGLEIKTRLVGRDRKEKVSKTFISKDFPTGRDHEPTE